MLDHLPTMAGGNGKDGERMFKFYRDDFVQAAPCEDINHGTSREPIVDDQLCLISS